MKLKLQTCLAIAALAILLAAPASASADAVADWNAIAVQATLTGARPGHRETVRTVLRGD